MNELERLGRSALERVRQVVEDGLDRAGVALQPLIVHLLYRLEALWGVFSFLLPIAIRFWLAMALLPSMEQLAEAVGQAVNATLILLFKLAVALIAAINVLALALVVILHRRGRRATREE